MPKKFKDKNKRFIFSTIKAGEFNKSEPVELISTAKQTDPFYGDFSYTKEEFQEMAKNFNDDVRGVEVAVDLNHSEDGKAFAWIEPGSMFVAESIRMPGEFSIFAKLYNYTPEGEELLTTGAYKYFSLEILYSFERFFDGVKKTFNNVIAGLAITNRPVIKGLAPTFSEKNILLSNSNNMELFKILLAELAKQPTVSLSEKKNMNTMFKKLSEEEQEEVKKDVEDVENKPEQTEEEKKAKEDADKELADAKKEAADAKKLAESKMSDAGRELNEIKKRAEKTDKELAEIKAEKKEEKIDKLLSEVTVSKDVETGFAGEAIEGAKEFVMTLSEEQAVKFFDIIKTVKSVDLSEKGGAGDDEEEDDDKELSEKKVKAYMKDNECSHKEATIALS